MSDHLPECQDALIPDWENERWICICKYLRACEQRVLDAALEAVDGLDKYHHGQISAADALAAIDALREKP